MEQLILIAHIILAIGIVAFVMMQQGKGADAGASFGSGASQTVFGSQGSGNFLTRTTAILATAFFVSSLGLAMYAKKRSQGFDEVGIPSAIITETLEQDTPVVEEYAPSSDVPALEVPELDASDAPIAN